MLLDIRSEAHVISHRSVDIGSSLSPLFIILYICSAVRFQPLVSSGIDLPPKLDCFPPMGPLRGPLDWTGLFIQIFPHLLVPMGLCLSLWDLGVFVAQLSFSVFSFLFCFLSGLLILRIGAHPPSHAMGRSFGYISVTSLSLSYLARSANLETSC